MSAVTVMRRGDERLLRGEGSFVADRALDGMTEAAIVRSPVAHGRLLAVDGSAALALPGVHAVLTAADLPTPVPHIPIRRAGRPGMDHRLQPVLATDRVRYVGEPIAVVVADDAYVAEAAADLVVVEIDSMPAVTDVRQPDLAALFVDAEDNVLYTFEGESGDPDAAFDAADVVVRIEASVGRQTGLPMETRGVVAVWDGGHLDLWGPTKFVRWTSATLAGLLGCDIDDVRAHRIDVGGMFGPRGEVYPEDFLVPWAARHVGRPVRWIEDRREHLLTINHSREQRHWLEVAAGSDGTLLAFRDRCEIDLGAYSRPIGARPGELVIETLPGPYRWHDYRVSCTGRLTNKTPFGTMRGPCGLEANFVRERAIDLVAQEVGLDPFAIRRRNLIGPDELPFRRTFGGDVPDMVYDAGDWLAAFDEIVGRFVQASLPPEPPGVRRGIGLGAFVEASGLGASETAEVAIATGGRIRVGTSASDVGQGFCGALTTIVGEALGVDPERIDVDLGSTSAHDGGSGTYGSRTTIFVGSAAQTAARNLLDDLRGGIAARAGVDPAGVTFDDDGATWATGSASWEEMGPQVAFGEHVSAGPTFGFGAVVAQVDVDAGTGTTSVSHLTVGYDCGRAIDPASVRGQLEGAAIQGIGGSLLEELVYDADGQPLSTTFMDYLVPTCAESPRVDAVVIEGGPVAGNPLGIRGAGEAGIVGVGAAIANAVAAATTGGRLPVEHLPIRPQVVAEALGHRGPREAPIPAAAAASRPDAVPAPPDRRLRLLVAAAGLIALAILGRRRRRG